MSGARRAAAPVPGPCRACGAAVRLLRLHPWSAPGTASQSPAVAVLCSRDLRASPAALQARLDTRPSPMRLLAGRATSPPPPPLASHLRHLRPEDTLRGTRPPARGRGLVRSAAPGVGPLEPPPPLPDPRPLSRAAPAPPGSRDPSASAASVHFWPGAASRAALSPPGWAATARVVRQSLHLRGDARKSPGAAVCRPLRSPRVAVPVGPLVRSGI